MADENEKIPILMRGFQPFVVGVTEDEALVKAAEKALSEPARPGWMKPDGPTKKEAKKAAWREERIAKLEKRDLAIGEELLKAEETLGTEAIPVNETYKNERLLKLDAERMSERLRNEAAHAMVELADAELRASTLRVQIREATEDAARRDKLASEHDARAKSAAEKLGRLRNSGLARLIEPLEKERAVVRERLEQLRNGQ